VTGTEVEEGSLNKFRRRALLENIDFLHQTNDVFFVLPGPSDTTHSDHLEVLRVVISDSAPQMLPVH